MYKKKWKKGKRVVEIAAVLQMLLKTKEAPVLYDKHNLYCTACLRDLALTDPDEQICQLRHKETRAINRITRRDRCKKIQARNKVTDGIIDQIKDVLIIEHGLRWFEEEMQSMMGEE